MANAIAKHLIKRMVVEWREELDDIKQALIVKGAEANTLEYNLLSAEALRLSCCITEVTDLLLNITEKEGVNPEITGRKRSGAPR